MQMNLTFSLRMWSTFMEDINFSAEGVTTLLKGLTPQKLSLGPDELHSRVLE